MDVGGMSWAVATTGGTADPSQSAINLTLGSAGPTFGGTYTSTSNAVTATGGACSATCLVNIGGALFGSQAAYAGVAMNVTDASVANGNIAASGLAIFSAAPPAATSGLAGGSSAAAAPLSATGSAATDWSRFNAAGLPAASPPAGAPELLSGVRSPTAGEAEAWLGGLVTFGE
jgi:hypothetical protein